MKRSLRVEKGTTYEISMSEILSLTDLEICNEIGELIFQPNYLDTYIKKLFISFYAVYS